MARESLLWDWMRKQGKGVERLDMRRVENLVSKGTPDVEACWDGRAFQAELKGALRPKRPTSMLRFEVSESQVLWLQNRWRCGGAAWIYARVGEGAFVERYLVPGRDARIVADGVTEEALGSLSWLPRQHSFRDFLERVSTQQED